MMLNCEPVTSVVILNYYCHSKFNEQSQIDDCLNNNQILFTLISFHMFISTTYIYLIIWDKHTIISN